jgi:putative nucleotidyltransferase with HDIG domain
MTTDFTVPNSENAPWFRLLARLSRSIDYHVDQQGVHSAQVAYWAKFTARQLGFSHADAQAIYWAARFHDIGKAAAPGHLLSKGGPLSEDEWRLIRLHPAVGANIIEQVPQAAALAPWIYHHQEKFDGTGYPDGLRGEQIPLPARLLTVVDAYDAMTNHRCYRPALGQELALRELTENSGRHFDPQVVAAFLRVVQRYPRLHPDGLAAAQD